MSLPIHPSKTGLTKVPLDSEPVGKFGSVSNLITLFHNLSFMELYCLVRTNCNECNKKTIKRTILRMPIILENISAVCVQGCINKKFFEKKSDFCCDKCQNFSKSESCRIMTSPPYLILYLETNGNSIIFENQSFIYDEEIEFFSLAGGDSPSKYKLVASINSPSPVHFNCSIKDPKINKEIYSGWFIHDGLQENGRIIQRENFSEMLKEKPFVLFDERNDLINLVNL